MIIRIALLIALIEFNLWNVATSTGYKCTPVTTELEKFESHILRRRTRAVLFPKNAGLLLTSSFTKAIIDGRPRGLSYSIEFDMYNTLPDTIEAWKPTILVNKIKQQQVKEKSDAAVAQTNTTVYSHHDASDEPNNWPFDGLNDGYGYYNFPLYEDATPNHWNYYQSQWDNDPTYFTRNRENPHIKKSFNLDSIAKQFHKKPYLDKRYPRNIKTHDEDERQPSFRSSDIPYQAKTKTQHELLLDQKYRERRHIFDQLETVGKLFHFNMKACIRRAMCEITTHLQPYGESLMEDIIRLILTIPPPPTPTYSDDYNHSYESINCEQHFAVSCPYRVLDILSHNIRSNMDQ